MLSPGLRVLLLGAVVAGLYLAREVLIPLALAVLFSFLLAPIARRLEALHLGRPLSTVAVVTLFVLLLAGVGWAAGNQMLNLIGKLPEYRQHIVHKLEALRSPPKDGDLGKAAKAIKQLEKDIKPGQKPPAEKQAQSNIGPLPTTPLELIGVLGLPLLTLVGMAVAVIVITALILLQRDDLRERLMRLVGEGHI